MGEGGAEIGCAPARCFGAPVTSGGLRSPNYNIVKTPRDQERERDAAR